MPLTSSTPRVGYPSDSWAFCYDMALALRNQYYRQKSVTITTADPDFMSPAVKLMSHKN